MAKQVTPLIIGIDIKGFENLDKLKGAFKGLSSAVAPVSDDIIKARRAIIEFGDANVTTTRLVNAQISGLKNLQSQVTINGALYKQLGSDIDGLKAKFTATTEEISQVTTVLDRKGSRVFGTSIDNLKKYNSNLQITQRELLSTAKSIDTTSNSVSNLGKSIKETQALKLDVNVNDSQVTKARGKITSTIALLRKLGEQSTTAVGAVGRTVEGITAAGLTAAAAKPVLGIGAGVAGSGSAFLADLSQRVTGLQSLIDRLSLGGKSGASIVGGLPEALAQRAQSLGGLEGRLSSLQDLVNSFTTTLGSIDPKAAAATGAVITAFAFLRDRVGNEMDTIRKEIDASFTGITEDTQQLLIALQRLGNYLGKLSTAEISGLLRGAQEGFAGVPAGSPRSRSFASQIAGLEAVQRGEAQAAADVLEEYRTRVAGTSVSTQNLGERLAYVKAKMQDLDVSTSEGSAAYAQYSNTVRNLEYQINKLADSYVHVGDVAKNMTAEINTANKTITNNYLNRQGVIRQQTAEAEGMAQLRQAVTAGVQGTPLLLPAAGQTSAPGTGLQFSGQNVQLGRRQTERFFVEGELGAAANAPRYGPTALPEQADRARRQAIAESDAQRLRGEAAAAAAQRMESLRAAVDRASKANTGSIASLDNLRQALNNVQRELAPTDKGFRQYRQQLQQVDQQIERLDRRRGRLGGQQFAQIAGASISGGIFGGPEGLIGGIAGGVLGGVGGSFAGAAFGAQAGMLRQQLGGTADYAAQIGKLQIALRGVAGTQSNYNQALNAAAAATRDLNVPQMEAIQGITRLSAAVLGAGGTIGDANFAFRAISESIKATGGNAEQVDGALLALTQVFSKGKVSAEELNQIAERLPGTFTLFAQAAGKSGPELQKALQQGQVGLNDLMKFLELASSRYGQTALGIAASSEEAGARMKIAFDQMRLEVGKALQPIGAELQTSFAKFAKDVTPTVINLSKGIAELLKVIVDNGTAILAITKLGLEFTAVVYAMRAFTTLSGPLKYAFDVIKLSMTDMRTAVGLAKLELQSFVVAARTAVASLAKPIVLTAVLVGAEVVIKGLRDIEDAKNNVTQLKRSLSAPEWLRAAGGDALTQSELSKLADIEAKKYEAAYTRLLDLQKESERMVSEGEYAGKPELLAAELKRIQGGGKTPFWGLERYAKQLEEAQVRLNIFEARYREAIKRLPYAPTTRPGGPGFPSPTAAGGTGAETEAERAAKQAAETERRLAQEGIKIQMDGQLKAFEYAVELDRRRYELQKQLSDEASAHEIANLQGGARTIAQAYATYRSRIAEIERGLVEAAQNTSLERERLRTSQAIEAVTAGTGIQGRYRQGSIGPTSTGPHFDIKQVGGGRFGRTDLDQYVQVNGRPLSTGTTLPGGTFDAPRPRGIHGGLDFAFSPGAVLELKGGAQWVNLGPSGGNGDMATFKTPDGKTYTILHGKFERTTGTTASTAQGRSQLLRQQKTAGKAGYAELGLGQAEALQQEDVAIAEQQKTSAFRTLVDTYTQSIRDQNYELRNSNDLNAERNRLIQAGASSEYIDYAMRLVEIRRTEADMISRINLEEKDPEKRAEQLRKLNELYAETGNLLRQNYELSVALDNSLGFREGAQRYVESIGTLREATAGLAQQGFKGIEDAIVSLATTGTANFAQFATSLLNDMARIIIQQFVMKQLTEAIMGLFGGPSAASTNPSGLNWAGINKYSANGNVFGANGIVPYAKGGVVTRPMLFPFANGGAIGTGLMGEAGPEAIMPLQRGPNGKLGVMAAGGGTTNVVVNVDATGGSSVQGDDDKANQLGKVISAAVQSELIKQKRPGGLLA
ncbi:MAG: tape measure protein [Candidatus Limnocylindrus sp.]